MYELYEKNWTPNKIDLLEYIKEKVKEINNKKSWPEVFMKEIFTKENLIKKDFKIKPNQVWNEIN